MNIINNSTNNVNVGSESESLERGNFEIGNKQNTSTSTMVKKKNVNNLFYNKSYNYVTSFAQICVLLYAVVILYFCFSGEFIFFTWHPLLMTIGWFMLMTQAILIVSKQDFLTRNFSHNQRVKYHWILLTIGTVLTTAAFLVIVANKINLNKHHFKTWHALLGLIAFILCIIGCLSGAATLYSTDLGKYISPRIIKFVHIVCGISAFLFGGLTMILTVYTKWYGRKSDENEFLFVTGFFIVTSSIVLTSFKPLVNLSKRGYQLFM